LDQLRSGGFTRSMSAMAGYFSGSVHIVSFRPSDAFLSDISPKNPLIGSLSLGKENRTSFRILDLNPTSDGLVKESKAVAILLKACRRMASSWGVHCTKEPV
jgi:hypothetical protein